MPDEIAFYYLPELNLAGAYLPGVPLRDLTQAEYDALVPWLQRSVAAQPFYTTERPAAASEPDAPASEE